MEYSEVAIKHLIKRFIYSEQGASSAEYAFLAALIAVAVIVTVQLVGQRLDAMLEEAYRLLAQR